MKKVLTVLLLAVLIPALVLFGALVFRERFYAWLALVIAVISCIPLFYAFERSFLLCGNIFPPTRQ